MLLIRIERAQILLVIDAIVQKNLATKGIGAKIELLGISVGKPSRVDCIYLGLKGFDTEMTSTSTSRMMMLLNGVF